MFTLSQGFFSVCSSSSEDLYRKLAQSVVRTGCPKLAKGIFHNTEHHTQYMGVG